MPAKKPKCWCQAEPLATKFAYWQVSMESLRT